MCIMAQPVRDVSNTRIFLGSAGRRQVTIYEMAVELQNTQRQRPNGLEAPTGNAMILPAPADSPDDIDLIDMTKAPKFFDGLDRIFANPMGYRSRRLSKGIDGNSLKVHQVGNYSVSIADTLADLDRLDPDVFTLSSAAQQALGPNYSRTDGPKFVFIVATLRESGKFHPLAYSHPLPSEGLFVPTRHEHGGDHDGSPEGTASWDHHIYHQAREADFAERPSNKQRRVDLGPKTASHTIQPWAKYTSEQVPALAPFLDDSEEAHVVRSRFAGKLRNMDLRLVWTPVAL